MMTLLVRLCLPEETTCVDDGSAQPSLRGLISSGVGRSERPFSGPEELVSQLTAALLERLRLDGHVER
jgi:hypothetical protein